MSLLALECHSLGLANVDWQTIVTISPQTRTNPRHEMMSFRAFISIPSPPRRSMRDIISGERLARTSSLAKQERNDCNQKRDDLNGAAAGDDLSWALAADDD